MFRLGIDVGGERVIGVLVNAKLEVVCSADQPTTPEVMGGIASVLNMLLTQSKVNPGAIGNVMVGTSYCHNALLEEENLAKVCALRISPAECPLPPLYEGSEGLRKAIGLRHFHIPGGHEVDGSDSLNEAFLDRLEKLLPALQAEEFESFAVTGTFSTVNSTHEQLVAKQIRNVFGDDCPITLSHQLGSVGFLERENAAILNAALSKVMMKVLKRMGDLLRDHGINASIYVTQNDGSLMSYENALHFPIRTFRSSSANCFRGASFLTKLNDCVVVDVGKSFTSVGMLKQGVPKEGGHNQIMLGIRVNFQMPELITLPYGSDQRVSEAMIDAIYCAVQRFQPRYEPLPIVFVGEGRDQVMPLFKYPWADIYCPDYAETISAIGACIAPLSGSLDRIFCLDHASRDEVVQSAAQEVLNYAVQAGADPKTVNVQSIEIIPFAYVSNRSLRIKAKAFGRLP